jgi:hypothetical protein
LIIIFCILSVNQLSYSQINIQERVEIAPQQVSAGHAVANGNNNSGDSIVVSIVAHLHYTAGAILSIDPTPVYPAYPVAGQDNSEIFQLLGGNDDAYIGTYFGWANGGYYISGVHIAESQGPLLQGSGYSVGNYTAYDGSYETDLVVHVTAVTPTINTCVVVTPERSPIYYGDSVNLLIQGNYTLEIQRGQMIKK